MDAVLADWPLLMLMMLGSLMSPLMSLMVLMLPSQQSPLSSSWC